MVPPILMVLLLSGCVLPADSQYVPAPENQPPRVTPLVPFAPKEIARLVKGCPAREYLATVTDPEGDTIYYHTFLDYHRDQHQDFGSGQASAAPAVSVRFNVSPDDLRFGGMVDAPHLVELLVADRPFVVDESQPGRVVEDGGHTDSVIWTVWLEPVSTSSCE